MSNDRINAMSDFAPTLLPHSLEQERTVLNAALEGGRVAEGLAPSDFHLPEHAAVWACILDAQRQGLSPEYQIVRHLLIERRHLDIVGAGYLIDLSAGGVRVSQAAVASLVQLLVQLRRQREAARLVLKYAETPANVNLDLLDRDLQALRIAHGVGAAASFRTARELAAAAAHVEWVMPGYLAIGAITELTGAAKRAGKTTLLGFFMSSILDGGKGLGGMTLPGPIVFLTEQTESTFAVVLRRAGLLQREDISILSYWDVKGLSWPVIARMAHRESDRIGARVVMVDTLAQFAGIKGDAENNSGDALEALAPLQVMAHHGKAILITRHARKSGGDVGEDGRGSSAFTGGVDIVLSLKRPEGHHRPTMRVLEGLSRFDETPARIVIDKVSVHVPDPELDVWTERFVVLGDLDAVAHDEAREAIDRHLPSTEGTALTMADLMAATSINRATLTRALKNLAGLQTVERNEVPAMVPPLKLLRFGAVQERIGLSRSTIWRLERRGQFPKHRRISANAVAWVEDELVAWIRAKVDVAI